MYYDTVYILCYHIFIENILSKHNNENHEKNVQNE
jgi:hypothetical protein